MLAQLPTVREIARSPAAHVNVLISSSWGLRLSTERASRPPFLGFLAGFLTGFLAGFFFALGFVALVFLALVFFALVFFVDFLVVDFLVLGNGVGFAAFGVGLGLLP